MVAPPGPLTNAAAATACSVCGGARFEDRPVLWPRLVEQWGLSPAEARYVDLQQGRTCLGCGANLRSIALGRALLAAWDGGPTLAGFLCDPRSQGIAVLDLNGAAGLTEALRGLPGYRLATYPQEDMQALSFADRSFDTVIHSDTLEHVADPAAGLRECLRVLKPGGTLCFTVPIIVGRLTRQREGLPPSYHDGPAQSGDDWRVRTEYGADAWCSVLEAGFHTVTLVSVQYPAALALSARRPADEACRPVAVVERDESPGSPPAEDHQRTRVFEETSMIVLSRPEPDAFRGVAARLLDTVSLNINPDDGMFHNDGQHYLSCGASALNVIAAAIGLAGTEPRSFLDFGSGAGRVTRWLRAAYPEAEIAVTDIRPQDLEFCEREFGASSRLSGIDIDQLAASSLYDVIWVGSVLTHLSARDSDRLVRKLFSWLRPDGILVVSIHGRFVHFRGPQFGYYAVGDDWPEVERHYLAEGYGYADYPGQQGYGISLTKLAWSAALAERLPSARVVLMSERAWDNHHDVLALQNRPITAPL